MSEFPKTGTYEPIPQNLNKEIDMVKLVLLATIMIGVCCMMSMARPRPARQEGRAAAGPRRLLQPQGQLARRGSETGGRLQQVSDQARRRNYLRGRHPGQGPQREVNDQDFEVALHVVFTNKEAHDKYQTHERHLQFIKEMTGKYENFTSSISYVSK